MWRRLAFSVLIIALACTIFLSGCINTAGPIQNEQATQPQAQTPDLSQKDGNYGSYVLHLCVEGNSIQCCDDAKPREEGVTGQLSTDYEAEIIGCQNQIYKELPCYILPLEECSDNQSCPNEVDALCMVIEYKEDGQAITVYNKHKPEIRTDALNISEYAIIKCKRWPLWGLYVLLALSVVIVGLATFFVYRRLHAKRRMSMPPPPPPAPAIPKARLVTPGNIDIPVAAGTMSIGRGDLARAVALDDLKYISKQHFTIDFSDDQYYVEDMNSMNGTKLNGVEIKGKGKQAMKDDDQIAVADVVVLTFRTA
jgi:hypothetical protein